MDKITHEMRLTQWTQVIRECRSSGVAIRIWCSENNVNEKQFYYWQRRIRAQAFNSLENIKSKEQSKFVQLPAPVDSLSLGRSSFSSDMVLHIGNNIIEISNTVSEELLSKVFKVISDAK
jgi:putative transposase